MINKKFLNIDDIFFIKKKISEKKLNKCILYISRQTNIKKNLIKKLYQKKIESNIALPKKNISGVDLVIKTKINKNYKYIDFGKDKIFYKLVNKNDISINKINKYQLDKIKFFPKTYISNSYVYQNLAKGSLYIPGKIQDIDNELKQTIGLVTNSLSQMNQQLMIVSEYLSKFQSLKIKDKLNINIINNFLFLLKNHKIKKLKTSLTHGDFKFDHLFILNKDLECVIDWENVGVRSIYFDIFNLFIPWFVKRSYTYSEIKKFVSKFVLKHLDQLNQNFEHNYDFYFSIYALERYERISMSYSDKSDFEAAQKRFHSLFYKIAEKFKI